MRHEHPNDKPRVAREERKFAETWGQVQDGLLGGWLSLSEVLDRYSAEMALKAVCFQLDRLPMPHHGQPEE